MVLDENCNNGKGQASRSLNANIINGWVTLSEDDPK